MVEQGRIDVFPKAGKRGSAFASYTSGFESFVFLNYTNKFKDVLTLAHELGHATHGFLSQKQKSHVFESPLCLAETASIFNETLISNKLKEKLSAKEKVKFLVEELDEIFASIFRQVQYVSFEERVHQKYLDGEVLTSVEFSKIWREEVEKLTGGIVEFPFDEDVSWMRIHHLFHYPFYCFTYAFGNILSFSLYEKYVKGELKVEEYKDILRAGGSKEPKELLSKYGIDIESQKFYQDGLKRVEEMVNELKELI